jgi:ABC-type sugar transport system substrate-binding protein
MPHRIQKQAVVIDAGMRDLAAAKDVAPHFEKVVVFNRDALPDAPKPRPGTPQPTPETAGRAITRWLVDAMLCAGAAAALYGGMAESDHLRSRLTGRPSRVSDSEQEFPDEQD